MACVTLSELHTGWDNKAVCVRLSRLWHCRGGLENGTVKLVHMVLVDAQGIHAYAVVPTELLTAYIDMLHEGVVYEFSRFVVQPRPVILNPIDAPLMIKVTQFTIIKNRFHLNDEFPEWTFNLTPINELPPAHDTPQTYIDVIGVITAISTVETTRVPHTFRKVFRRHVMLSDNKLPPSFPAIEHLPTPSKIILQVQHADVHPMALLAHLMNINLYHKEAGTFRCNVIITRVPLLKKWCNTFCTDYNYMSMPASTSLTQPNVYTCRRSGCSCTSATLRYTLSVLAKDRSGEAQFELYESKAQQLIGRSAGQVLHSIMRHDPTVRNIHVAASMLRKTPLELTALLSMRCKFVVRVSHDCFLGRWPSFIVDAIESFEPMKTNLSVMDLLTPS